MIDVNPLAAYQMLYDYFYRVAHWPDNIDVGAINAGFGAIKTTIEQNELLKRDLSEANRLLEIERKARWEDITKIDSLTKEVKRLRRGTP